MAASSGSEESEEYVDALGVITALERTCELEARLRQAIQDTHPLTTTLDWDFNAADKEREGLLAISEQLEYLEDKLREYRFLEPSELENKAVLLSQLDAVRRELVDVVDRFLPHITFGKEVVRDVLAFAQVSDDGEQPDSGRLGPSELGHAAVSSSQELRRSHASLLQHGSGSGSMGGFASEIEAADSDTLNGNGGSGGGGAPSRRVQRVAYAAEDGEGGEGTAVGGLIPALRRSGSGALNSRPPRYPASQQQGSASGGKEQTVLMVPGPKEEPRPASSSASGPLSPSSLNLRQQQILQQQQVLLSPPSRSAFLQQQQRDTAAAAAAAAIQPPPRGYGPASGAASPGAAATASALRSAAATAAGGALSRSGRRQLDVDAAARVLISGPSRAGAEAYSFGPGAVAAAAARGSVAGAPSAAGAQLQAFPVAGPSSYPPSSYAPSEGIPSSRQSPYSARTHITGGAAPPAQPAQPAPRGSGQRLGGGVGGGGGRLLTRLNRSQQGGFGDSASGSRYDAYSRVSDEDIYGALEGSKARPASIINPSPQQYGGFVRISDRLRQAEQSAALVPGPRSPMPPRIYGDAEGPGSDAWETASEIHPAGYAASLQLDPPRGGSGTRERPIDRPPRITHSAPAPVPGQRTPVREQGLHLAYSSGGAGVVGRSGRPDQSTARIGNAVDAGASSRSGGRSEGGGGGGRLLGRLTNLVLTGAAAAAVAVVAQHAGPAVVQKSQQVARSLQGAQAAAASKWEAHQRRRQAAREQRKKQEASSRLAGKPSSPSTFRGMAADLPRSPQRADQPGAARQQGSQPTRMPDLPPGLAVPPMPGASKKPDAAAAGRQQAAAAAAAAAAGAAQRQQAIGAKGPAAALVGGNGGGSSSGKRQADPLPPHLAGAMRGMPAGGGRAAGPLPRAPAHGQLFPAMPPPDVTASMG